MCIMGHVSSGYHCLGFYPGALSCIIKPLQLIWGSGTRKFHLYGCPIFKWVAVTWLIYGTRAVIRLYWLPGWQCPILGMPCAVCCWYSTANKLCIWVPARDRIWSRWRPIDSLDINVCRKKNSFFQDKIRFLVIICSPCWVVLKEC